ncbi:hypothetical protein SBV1_1610010 [Verrucomicrobia bacterium]|nr:hypothetical protein SBV1_1610010 [Verrucomicrobiota bacterium]
MRLRPWWSLQATLKRGGNNVLINHFSEDLFYSAFFEEVAQHGVGGRSGRMMQSPSRFKHASLDSDAPERS